MRANNVFFGIRRSLSLTSSILSPGKILNKSNMNPNVVKMEFAVLGPVASRAGEIEKELANGVKKPFPNVIRANHGDAHAMGQKPITYIRQLVACVANPSLMETDKSIPSDVIQNAKAFLGNCGGRSAGAYTQSPGVEIVRKHIAEYITKRDGGIPANWEDVCISSGTSESIRNVLKLFINDKNRKKVGVMIPIPQYPLYSASLDEFGLGQVGYYLNESSNWSLDEAELERSLKESSEKYDVRVLCVINPGNPTGQVLSRENIETIVRFAEKNNLFIIADEVYQDNVYSRESKFHSFKKVVTEMGAPYDKMEIASFHSASKGFMGECGMRGGYVEFLNMDSEVYMFYKKMISAKLCSSVLGQAVVDALVNPPKKGQPSYELWKKEGDAILASLKERAELFEKAFSKLEGVSCTQVQGALYAYPSIKIPAKAVEKARSLNQEPDFFYAMQLLETTGICIVPGSGFGQKDGTYHFRSTILPPSDLFKEMLKRFTKFHNDFLAEYK